MVYLIREQWESDLGHKVRSMCIARVVGNTGMAAVQPIRSFIYALNEICPEMKYNPLFGPHALLGWEYNASEVADEAVKHGLNPETVLFIASVHLLPDG
jgi:hypothetical protein